MIYAIELYFSDVSEARLRSLYDACERAGAISTVGIGYRPHLSLVVARHVNRVAVERLLERFAHGGKPLALSMSGIGFFPSIEPTIFIAPKVSHELLALHETLVGRLDGLCSEIFKYYSTPNWFPHCTLAGKCPHKQFPALLNSCLAFDLPVECEVVEIGLISYPLQNQLCRFKFAS